MRMRRFAFALSLFLLPALASAEVKSFKVDPAHSNVGFSIRHLMSKVRGAFGQFEGTIQYDPANPSASSVSFTVQAASIDTQHEDRDKHLRSPDFFDVEKFPTLTFKSTSVKAAGDGQLEVTGDLTIHGVTKSVTVPVEVLGMGPHPRGGQVAGFESEFTVNRKDFGIVWNRILDAGGALLGDEVTIELAVEAGAAS